jgi:twinkle protein
MTELELARVYLGDFAIKGDEIIPRLCPFCRGGQHHDKETFALNMEKHTYKCLRGSCGAQGHFTELLKHFGEQGEKVYSEPVKRAYTRPQPQQRALPDAVGEYITARGINAATRKAYGVHGNDRGEVVFPYYETPEEYEQSTPTFVKYRPGRKLKKGEPKARREKGAKPILMGMHLCTPGEMLYIFEGEFDCMAGWQAHGGNCVSVPSGCKDFAWIDTCAEFLEGYSQIAVIGDNDEPGREMVDAIIKKFDHVYVPDFELYGGCKDTNEILFKHGAERVCQIMDTVRPSPILGLINIADVKAVDMTAIPRTLSGIKALDRMTGGLYMGDLNVWTGKRGEGKSTILTQIMLEAVEQGNRVCAYSGEIPADRFKYGVFLQAADSLHVCEKYDSAIDRAVQYVPKQHRDKINDWLNGMFWLYDNKIAEADEAGSIIRVFEQAYKRHDCRVFMVDNLMTVQTCKNEKDFYHAQADFTIRLRKFAEQYGVSVHLVVHPRKTSNAVGNDDVGGLSTITNIACAVFAMKKLEDQEARDLGCEAILTCTKNRAYGTNGDVKLRFIEASRRFVEIGAIEKPFSWNKDFTEIDDAPPF